MLYIDGKWCDAASGRTFDVINPATGGVIGTRLTGSAVDARVAVEAAARVRLVVAHHCLRAGRGAARPRTG